jgi:hypothetical protein
MVRENERDKMNEKVFKRDNEKEVINENERRE